MPLKLVPPREGRSPFWRVCGTYLGVRLNKSTKTRKRTVALQALKRIERDIERCEFTGRETTFAGAAIAYMNAGGERTYLTKLLQYFGDTPISRIGQNEIDDAASRLARPPPPQLAIDKFILQSAPFCVALVVN